MTLTETRATAGPHQKPPTLRRLTAGLAAATLAVGVTLLAATPARADASSTQAPTCPTFGQWPAISHTPLFTGGSVSIYVGGNATLTNSEVEGLVAVQGDLTIATTSSFYPLGVVGGGSQMVPGHGALMLWVGGDVNLGDSRLMVGAEPQPTGTYMIQGAVNGIIDTGIRAEYQAQPAEIGDLAAEIAQTSTGLLSGAQGVVELADGGSLVGDNSSSLQRSSL